MAYSLYPGCSLHATGLEYRLSMQAVFQHLGIDLFELRDWNCCGASSAHALDHTLALSLPARNLALAIEVGYDLVIPCAACFNRIKATDQILRNEPSTRAKIEAVVGYTFDRRVAIRPALAVVSDDDWLVKVAARVKLPLHGLKVVPYYGCLLVRPPAITEFDDPDNPQQMTKLLQTVGAEVRSWSYATECCGGSLSLSRSDVVYRLVGRLVERAREAGADALVTACPLCQVNLEMRQRDGPEMPAFYFTELLGLAFDLPESSRWWGKHLIDPRPVLRQAGLLKGSSE